MVQFHAKLVTTHIQLTIPRHKKLKPWNLETDADGEKMESLSLLRSLLLLAACLLLL